VGIASPREAILLLGPTGAGKTPLGEWLDHNGLWGRRCHHFDFGARLRDVAALLVDGFTADEIGHVRDVLEKGALLENETFYMALRILISFIKSRQVQSEDMLVMNGLPRHAGQAQNLVNTLKFAAIVDLRCSAEVVWERLQSNAGGDRTARADDGVTLVQQKLNVFADRTRPLLAWYQQRGVPLIPVAVGAQTRPADIMPVLERAKA
jgi:adenylate kinase